jgi:2'-5' RNA ligase
VRLFVGVWPPPEVKEVLGSLARPDAPGVRWTAPDRWHVTLAFMGDVPEEEQRWWPSVVGVAARAVPAPPDALLGPATVLLGPAVLCLPVAGLDAAADAVCSAATALGLAHRLEARPFRGHLTVARAKGRGRIPRRLAGAALEASWAVDELCLVASVPGPGPARYRTLARSPVGR